MVAFGEQDAYLPYRHLSSYSHTTRETARLYLHPTGAGGWALRDRPRESGLNDVIWTAVCLIQAGRVLDSILTRQPLAEELDQATAHLGIPGNIVPRRRPRQGAGNRPGPVPCPAGSTPVPRKRGRLTPLDELVDI
jgi:hypothetical protein